MIRLSPHEQDVIIAMFKKYFTHQEDHLWIFGSRVDPTRKGGDIDLYIETKETNERVLLEQKISFMSEIKLLIGDQKIDIVIKTPQNELPIHKEARITGIKLV